MLEGQDRVRFEESVSARCGLQPGRRIVQSRGDADDVTQEALPRALRSIPAPEANHTGKLGHRANYDRERLAYALEELPAPFREILVLRELEGCSYKEIAAIAARPIGTVRSGLARARQQLRTAHTRPAQKEVHHGM